MSTNQNNLWGNSTTQFFYDLHPDLVLKTIDDLGFKTTGRVMTLNSMENRVYDVEIESDSENPSEHFKIIKFYRPGRWSKNQILDEHRFLLELEEFEIPVIPPEVIKDQTLFELKINDHDILYYTVFRKQGGRAPDEFTIEEIEQVGRLIARMHNVGAMNTASHRIILSPENYLVSNLNYLLNDKKIPTHYELQYKNLLDEIYNTIKNSFKNIHLQRIHGDCHLGNIIKRENIFHLIDFDDMVTGPAIQDLWLILPGRDEYSEQLRTSLLNGYQEMREFNFEELKLTEILRTLRMINYSAWIAKRFDDPAFKNAFPFFDSPNYWEGQINDLREQLYYIKQ